MQQLLTELIILRVGASALNLPLCSFLLIGKYFQFEISTRWEINRAMQLERKIKSRGVKGVVLSCIGFSEDGNLSEG